MEIIYKEKEKKQTHLTIHSLDELKELMKKSYDCLFFASKHEVSMYSLYLDRETDTLTKRAQTGDITEITERNVSHFRYFKLDDSELYNILKKS